MIKLTKYLNKKKKKILNNKLKEDFKDQIQIKLLFSQDISLIITIMMMNLIFKK
jgi:hypothetical protein